MYAVEEGTWIRGFVEHQTGLRLGTALGILGRGQLSLELPTVLHQDAQLPGFGLGSTSSTGFGDMEIELKVRVHEPIRGLTTAFLLHGTVPTGDESSWLSDGGTILPHPFGIQA